MENIVNYIIEKFKINSKTISKNNKNIEINFKEDEVDFPNGDVKKIIDYANSLQILPDKIEYFYNSNAIRLGYLYKDNKKIHYCIVFNYLNTNKTKGYRIEYMKDFKDNSYIEYPEFPKTITLKESFDYIDKNFDDWIK